MGFGIPFSAARAVDVVVVTRNAAANAFVARSVPPLSRLSIPRGSTFAVLYAGGGVFTARAYPVCNNPVATSRRVCFFGDRESVLLLARARSRATSSLALAEEFGAARLNAEVNKESAEDRTGVQRLGNAARVRLQGNPGVCRVKRLSSR